MFIGGAVSLAHTEGSSLFRPHPHAEQIFYLRSFFAVRRGWEESRGNWDGYGDGYGSR